LREGDCRTSCAAGRRSGGVVSARWVDCVPLPLATDAPRVGRRPETLSSSVLLRRSAWRHGDAPALSIYHCKYTKTGLCALILCAAAKILIIVSRIRRTSRRKFPYAVGGNSWGRLLQIRAAHPPSTPKVVSRHIFSSATAPPAELVRGALTGRRELFASSGSEALQSWAIRPR
jgi:hypothetical protein